MEQLIDTYFQVALIAFVMLALTYFIKKAYYALVNHVGMKVIVSNRSHKDYKKKFYIVGRPHKDVYAVSKRPKGVPDLLVDVDDVLFV
jgi:hypothetical protein